MKKVWHNLCYVLRFSHKTNCLIGPIMFLEAIIGAVMPFVLLMLSREVLNGISTKGSFDTLVTTVIVYSAVFLFCFFINAFLGWVRTQKSMKTYDSFSLALANKAANIDLVDMENAETLNMYHKAESAIWYGSIGILAILVSFVAILFELSGYLYLFGTISPWLFAAFILPAGIHLWFERKNGTKLHDLSIQAAPYERKAAYLVDVQMDFNKGKDIRLFSAQQKLQDALKDNNKAYSSVFRHKTQVDTKQKILDLGLSFFLRLFIYVYFTIEFLNQTITIGDFAIFIATTEACYHVLLKIPGTFIEIRNYALHIADYIQFLQQPTHIHAPKNGKELNAKQVEFQFENVSFRYPNTVDFALKGLNLTIPFGEKLTIVGDNGSGKSTMIKLLMRLYDPSEGRILVNGIDIREFSFSEYAKLFAPVFQDYRIFAFSIAENILLREESIIGQDKQLEQVLTSVGLHDKISSLASREQSLVFRSYDENGIMLSGGEQQKLAIARSLYHDRPVHVFDEPSSALDPESERNLYQKLHQLAGQKTAVFISHRMSHCLLADRVTVMDEGRLVAVGTHTELNRTSTQYQRLWDAQANQYNQV